MELSLESHNCILRVQPNSSWNMSGYRKDISNLHMNTYQGMSLHLQSFGSKIGNKIEKVPWDAPIA